MDRHESGPDFRGNIYKAIEDSEDIHDLALNLAPLVHHETTEELDIDEIVVIAAENYAQATKSDFEKVKVDLETELKKIISKNT